ncbi:MAG: TIGR02099 family protein [Xanthomonadales bacterium]|nr:TIGR02099 family protein [Xanthomonadales bacterium]ODU93095.1 MAG: TIGR02099 family protein [Rhodanobacter sp. SCN 66-43]OJY83736.1 MAG: TIGR02099 family protein [Xanthomonadales bacterium 66-474]
MSAWRHHLRRARFALTASIAVLLIAVAVAMGVVQLLLPLATHYPDFIARQLSARLHRPVEFAAIGSQWQPSGPLLTVRDLTLGPAQPGGQSITLPHAALKFDFGAWLRPAHRWITLRLNDLELQVEHSTTGWEVTGFGTAGGESHASLQSLPVDLDLSNLHVRIVDQVTQRSWQLLAPRLRLVNIGDSLRFGGSVQQLGTHQAATISGSMDAAARDYALHVSTHDIDLAEAVRGLDLHRYAVASGRGDFDVWGSWRDGKLDSATVRYAMRDLAASGPEGRDVDLASLAGVFQAKRAADGWDLAWRGPGKPRANIDAAGGALVRLRGHAGAWRVSAAAQAVDVTPWLSLLAMAPQAPKPLVDWVRQAQPHLRIDSAALLWDGADKYDATLRFSGLHAGAAGAVPGIALSHGILRADPEAVSLELPQQAAVLALTDTFRTPFTFTRFGGSFVAWRADGLWNIGADGLHFDTGELAGNARAHLVWLGNGHRPFLSASGALERGKATDAKLFWPYRSMPASLIAWLDHAFVGGEVTAGRVLIRGNLDDWPFLDHQGRFEATGAVKNAEFDFADEWPRATEVDAALDFIDNHMGIVATHAKVQGVVVTHAVATIPDLHHGVLGLDIQGGGSGAQLLDFVRHSPVGAGAIEALQGLSVGGTGKFGIKLSIPLDDAAKFSLDGKVNLANADVTAAKWKLALKNLSGPLAVNGTGFRAQDLATTFRGAPAKLSMAVGGGNVADPKDIVEASLDASVSAQTLVQGYPDLASLVAHASGVAPFHIGVRVVQGAGNAPVVPILDVQSSLAGIALDFPAPLDKPAASTLPLDFSLQLPPDGAPLTVSLGDVLRVRGRLADPPRKLPTALAMNFGNTLPENVPASGLVVGGHAARLDVSGWIEQALGTRPGAAFPQLARAEVGTDEAEVFGTALGPLQFDFEAGAQDDTVGFEGAAVKGTLQLPVSDLMARGITAHFERLYWPEPPPPKQPAAPVPPPSTSPVAPTAVPPLHVTIGDLRLGNAHLGETVFESTPTPAGMRISRFDSKGADFTIQSHGDWNGDTRTSASQMVIDISSHDFGKTLAAFGFSGLLSGGKDSQVHIDGNWPGAPSSFSLAWMSGALSIKVGEGSILAVKPGLGRLLGLLSLRELPSRLLLHFGDVFKSGFGFDDASANFALKDGNAWTHDMQITAPAAKIAMYGRTGFRARDYDLTVDVTPHVGGTLPVVGAVIGGPVGAAAGLVVQGLIGKGLNKAAGSVYRVTGSWDKPKIVTIASAPAPAAASSVAPATTAPSPASTAPPAPASSVLPVPASGSSTGMSPAPAATVQAPAPADSG